MWICWVATRTVAHSLWSLSRLVKCLSGAIKFEYRIRPDWQDIMLLLATGFANRHSACDFLQWAFAFTYRGLWITTCCRLLLWQTTRVSIIIYVVIFVSKGDVQLSTAGKICAAVISAHWRRQHQHHELLSVMMGCMVLLGVFALSVNGGWRTVLVAGVQLSQQGTRALSKNSEDLVLGMNIELLF